MSDLSESKVEAFEALARWVPTDDPDKLKILGDLAERSLKEVKALTEYEDGKAQRILTAVAFLAAVAGGVFALAVRSFKDAQIITNYLSTSLPISWLATIVYIGFALYAILLAIGGFRVLDAVRPRFHVPEDWQGKDSKALPTSFLFFEKILEISKLNWVQAFANTDLAKLQQEYIKNSIIETYIVAEKIRKKMKPLQSGVSLLFASTIILSIWLPFAILAIATPSFHL